MKPEDVRARVEEIRKVVRDCETAHGMEDHLYVDILKAISAGECEDAKACATIALEVDNMDFTRWYA